ncbi:MAG TPA: DUF1501 domain-containing protein, partial [Pirellulales bacterium]|nr:DUF1501 domain-containing protein [Pirellulales bacterium]
KPNPTLAMPRNQRTRGDFPNLAAVLSHFSPPAGLPASVTIPRPIGHDGVTYAGTYAGFLGPAHDPMELRAAGEVNLPATHSLELPDGLDMTRVISRFGLLKLIDEQDRAQQHCGAPRQASAQGPGAFREQAFRMLTSPEAKGAFDLEREASPVRDRYGRNEYGESFLLARRLVEAGVRMVSVIWLYICPDGNVANVWDNHGGTGSLGGITGYQMLKEKYCLPPLDQALSALLEDLSASGLLDETLVLAMGELAARRKSTPAPAETTGAHASRSCWPAAACAAGRSTARAISTRHIPSSTPFHPRTCWPRSTMRWVFLPRRWFTIGRTDHTECAKASRSRPCSDDGPIRLTMSNGSRPGQEQGPCRRPATMGNRLAVHVVTRKRKPLDDLPRLAPLFPWLVARQWLPCAVFVDD